MTSFRRYIKIGEFQGNMGDAFVRCKELVREKGLTKDQVEEVSVATDDGGKHWTLEWLPKGRHG